MESIIDIKEEIKLRLTPIAENYLLTATRWAKFISILGFIFSGFLIIVSLFISTIMSLVVANNPLGGATGFPLVLLSTVYIVMAIIYFLMSLSIYNFAVKSQRSIKLRDESIMEGGMKAIKNYFLIIGILAIVGLSLIILLLFIAIIAGIAAI